MFLNFNIFLFDLVISFGWFHLLRVHIVLEVIVKSLSASIY